MNELAYVINVSKASIDDVKNAFKTMFSDPTKKTQIFEVIWTNQNLRETLLNNPSDEIQGFQKLNQLISELDNSVINNPILYSFIKAE